MSDTEVKKPKYTAVRMTGLFPREYNGETKLSGKLPDGTLVEIVENKYRSKETHPTHYLNKVVTVDSVEGAAEIARRDAYKAEKAAKQAAAQT